MNLSDNDLATMIDVLIHYICDPDVPLAYGDTTIEEAEALLKTLKGDEQFLELEVAETYNAYQCPWCMKEYPLSDFKEDELPLCSICVTAILQRVTVRKMKVKEQ